MAGGRSKARRCPNRAETFAWHSPSRMSWAAPRRTYEAQRGRPTRCPPPRDRSLPSGDSPSRGKNMFSKLILSFTAVVALGFVCQSAHAQDPYAFQFGYTLGNQNSFRAEPRSRKLFWFPKSAPNDVQSITAWLNTRHRVSPQKQRLHPAKRCLMLR